MHQLEQNTYTARGAHAKTGSLFSKREHFCAALCLGPHGAVLLILRRAQMQTLSSCQVVLRRISIGTSRKQLWSEP
jgi:hypothetical protein